MRWAAQIMAAALVLAAGAGAAQQAPAKLALVIGNADYNGDGRIDVSAAGAAASEAAGYVPDLRNPLNDAADIRDALHGIGFRVDFVQNADGAQMRAALATFAGKISAAPADAQVAIYFAGHAIQVDGVNFLIPVRSHLPVIDYATLLPAQARVELAKSFFAADDLVRALREPRAPGVNLVILDSCRTNPWSQTVAAAGRGARAAPMASGVAPRGMARLDVNVPRTVVVFSTSPGAVALDGDGRNSPFSNALKRWIGRSGTVLEVLNGAGNDVQVATGGRQTPWFQSASVFQTCLVVCTDVDPRKVGNVLANDGRPWRQRLAAGADNYSATRFGVSLQMLETRDMADVLSALDIGAIEQMRADAASDDAFAQWALGWALLSGKIAAPDLPGAIRQFEKSAAAGHPAGMESYGNLLVAGTAGPQRIAEGLRLLNAAADQGFASANFSLADIYEDGVSVPRDPAKAAQYLRRAAEGGHIYAMVLYANKLVTGDGVLVNGQEALQWYRRASMAGNPDGAYGVGRMLARGEAGVPADYGGARQILEQSLAMRNFNSANELGRIYELGLGVSADRAKALQYYRVAAQSAPEGSIRANAAQAIARLSPPLPRVAAPPPAAVTDLPVAIDWALFNDLAAVARVGAGSRPYTTTEAPPTLERLDGRLVQLRGRVRAGRWSADPDAMLLARTGSTRIPRPDDVMFSKEIVAVYLRRGQATPRGEVTVQGTLTIARDPENGVALSMHDAVVMDH